MRVPAISWPLGRAEDDGSEELRRRYDAIE